MTDYLSTPGLRTRDHEIEVPLVHGDDSRGTITVYAREIAAPDGLDRPFLVYLQGGPGHEAFRPAGPSTPPWLERALGEYRVLMLDQRGTGRSTPFDERALTTDGRPGGTPRSAAEVAEYLTHLRADAIVEDAELLRAHLGVERWSLLGQSFGGFTALRYLSTHRDHLDAAYFTGGLPPVGRGIDDVYARTYDQLRRKSEAFYARRPGTRDRMRQALEACAAGEVVLPGGDVVSPRRLRSLGMLLGGSGGHDTLAHLLEFDVTSAAFRHDLATLLPFDGRNPLYAVVHESSYSDGGRSAWAADRLLPEDFVADETLLTGEHVSRAFFEENSELAPYAEVADLVAEVEWPRLYDADVLRSVDVPCAAAIYADDAYVFRAYSEETAALIPTMRPWITNEYEHNGLRAGGGAVLDRLIRLAHDR
ncbi:alpha/beta fold hydrolase [Mobilicoccus pelagius]|uniref:alpha/beta fold hydrolase n=1 Tax=Mobilicoccus pelagius TaxID=746032 RepID=UPI0002FD335F|nr:alpha/beta fold hydrolase [Mobilicoccus pelagius]